MAIVNLHIEVNQKYKNYIIEAYRLIVVIFTAQIIFSCMNPDKNFFSDAFTGDILNDNILVFTIVILVAVAFYTMVVQELLKID